MGVPGVTNVPERQMLAQRPIGVQCDAGAALEAPARGAGLGARHGVTHGIGEFEIPTVPVRRAGTERVGIDRSVLLVAAEIVRPRLQPASNTAEIVVPDEWQQR